MRSIYLVIVLSLLVVSLGACSGIEAQLAAPPDPRHHPFDTYASGGGGSH